MRGPTVGSATCRLVSIIGRIAQLAFGAEHGHLVFSRRSRWRRRAPRPGCRRSGPGPLVPQLAADISPPGRRSPRRSRQERPRSLGHLANLGDDVRVRHESICSPPPSRGSFGRWRLTGASRRPRQPSRGCPRWRPRGGRTCRISAAVVASTTVMPRRYGHAQDAGDERHAPPRSRAPRRQPPHLAAAAVPMKRTGSIGSRVPHGGHHDLRPVEVTGPREEPLDRLHDRLRLGLSRPTRSIRLPAPRPRAR